jgi:hypothetical protein
MTHCKCAFIDADGTFVPGEACAIHPNVKPQREAPSSKNQLIAIEMAPVTVDKTEMLVRFNRPFTTAEMNTMHRALNLHLVGSPSETTDHLNAQRINDNGAREIERLDKELTRHAELIQHLTIERDVARRALELTQEQQKAAVETTGQFVEVGDLVDVQDDVGTILAVWNERRDALPAGTKFYIRSPVEPTREQPVKGTPPLDREEVNILALECARASKVVRGES